MVHSMGLWVLELELMLNIKTNSTAILFQAKQWSLKIISNMTRINVTLFPDFIFQIICFQSDLNKKQFSDSSCVINEKNEVQLQEVLLALVWDVLFCFFWDEIFFITVIHYSTNL